MSKIESFTDLLAWQSGHKAVLSIYKATETFPKTEQFSLTNQIRRAAISTTSNIAEGFNRFSNKDKIHFFNISLSSAAETQAQLLIARDLGYMSEDEHDQIQKEVIHTKKLISGLIRSLSRTKETAVSRLQSPAS